MTEYTTELVVSDIMAYEGGEMSKEAMLKFFSTLVSTGKAWTLQGHYGRTAKALIDEGYLSPKGDILRGFKDDE